MVKTLSLPTYIGIGSNLASAGRSPLDNCERAIDCLGQIGLSVLRRSRWYASAPVPAANQPRFVNGVVEVANRRAPEQVLPLLLNIERRFGRRRGPRNAARILDLDLLACGSLIRIGSGLALPHPRLHRRAFVLRPMADVAPGWRHPIIGRTVAQLAQDLATGQQIAVLS